jgi:pimeloyl-ACP methyl ester carboxylesterase
LLEGGDGPPIVFLHGQGNVAAAWMTVIPDLVSTYHVIAPDLPGLGASEVSEGSPEANAVLVWFCELIDHTCVTPTTESSTSESGLSWSRADALPTWRRCSWPTRERCRPQRPKPRI